MGYIYASLLKRPVLSEFTDSLGVTLLCCVPMSELGDVFGNSYLMIISSTFRIPSDIGFDWFTPYGSFSWQCVRQFVIGV